MLAGWPRQTQTGAIEQERNTEEKKAAQALPSLLPIE